MDMRVVGERLPPSVQEGDEPDLGPQMPRVSGDRPQRLRRRPEQHGIDLPLILEGHGRYLGRHGEDDMEVRHRQQIGLPVGQPIGPRQPLALRAMSVAAGVVGDAAQRAALASFDMPTERCSATGFDRRHHPALDAAHPGAVGKPIRFAMAAEDVRHLQGRAHDRELKRAAPPPGPSDRAGSGSWRSLSSPPGYSAPSSTGCCVPGAPG